MLRLEQILSRRFLKTGVSSCSSERTDCRRSRSRFAMVWFKSILDICNLAKVCDSVKISSLGVTIDSLFKFSLLVLGIAFWLFVSSEESERFKRCVYGLTLCRDLKQQLSSVFSGPSQTSCLVASYGNFCYAALRLALATNTVKIAWMKGRYRIIKGKEVRH
jgi:hypothetical protein